MADQRTDAPEPRRRRPRTPAGIPYSTVEALAADLHDVGDDGLAALRARLHSLRRLDFPNGVSGSSGRHFDYGLADVIGVLAALELAEAYVPPAAAVAIVREGWPEIARCALAGLADSKDRGIATVHPNALFQALADAGGRTADTLHVEIAGLGPPAGDGRAIDIAVGSMSRTAVSALDRLDRRAAEIARAQLPELEARFGTGAALPRPEVPEGRLRSDGPYWSRAGALVSAVASGAAADRDLRRLDWQLGYIARPAPVEAWKTRVEVHPDLDDIPFAAAVATLAHRAGLRHARVRLSADDADRTWGRLTRAVGGRDAVAARLCEIAATGEQLSGLSLRPGRPVVGVAVQVQPIIVTS